jgi:hypothetical protein
MSHPAERRVAQAVRDLAWVQSNLGRVLGALSALTPTGWSNGAGGATRGDTHSGGPTANAAVNGIELRDRYARIDSLAVEVTGLIRQLADELENVPDIAGTEAAVKAARCTGGDGEWADPTCTELEARPGLCWRCLKRKQRWETRQQEEAS